MNQNLNNKINNDEKKLFKIKKKIEMNILLSETGLSSL